jgi:gluconolactonase
VFAVCEHGLFDGFRLDAEGNLWSSAGAGVNCYAPSGDLLGRIPLPEGAASVTFGGPRRNRLVITASPSLCAVYLVANGAQRP